jgi:hypothetical protein
VVLRGASNHRTEKRTAVSSPALMTLMKRVKESAAMKGRHVSRLLMSLRSVSSMSVKTVQSSVMTPMVTATDPEASVMVAM